MMEMEMELLVEDGMALTIADLTRIEGSVIFAVIWKKHPVLHLTTMEEDLQFTAEIFIYQHHKKENIPGLSTCVKILFVSYNMLVAPLMLATDGAPQNLRVWAGTNPTQDCTNILWKVVLNIYRLEMSNI